MADRFQGKFVVLSLRKAMTEAAIVTEGQKVRTVSLEYHHHNNSPFANFFPRIIGKESDWHILGQVSPMLAFHLPWQGQGREP